MEVEGTNVLLVPIDGGVALVFTTSQSSPVVLRRTVLRFARQYQSLAREQSGTQPAGGAFPAGVPTYSRYADTIAGARVEIRPRYGAQLAQLQTHLRRLASNMRERGVCHAPAVAASVPAPTIATVP